MNRQELEAVARSWTLAQPIVRAMIAAAIPHFHDAQDVLQEVAAAVISGRETPGAVNFNAFALGIARHKVADYYRQKGRRAVLMLDGEILDQLQVIYAQKPEDWSRQIEALDRCVTQVKGRAQQLLELRYKSDLTSDEIAATLKQSPSAVRVALMRVRELLRECIENKLALGAT